MNRRQFTQRLAALAATPLLPGSTLAKAAAPAAAPMHAFTHPYSWAAFVSRIHNKASPDMFKRQLSLSDEMAKQVYDTLIKENVITAPNAVGISQATQPFRRDISAIQNLQPEKAFDKKPAELKAKRGETLDEERQDTTPEVEKTDEDIKLEADSETVNQETTELEDDKTNLEDSTVGHSEDAERPD